MTLIERTAYPRFVRPVSARELTGMSPSAIEVACRTAARHRRDAARFGAHDLVLGGIADMVAGAGMIVGYGWRLLTAGVAEANQGAGPA